MNPHLLNQKMIQNNALLSLYQARAMPLPMVSPVQNQLNAYQSMVMRVKALQFAQYRQICLQNMCKAASEPVNMVKLENTTSPDSTSETASAPVISPPNEIKVSSQDQEVLSATDNPVGQEAYIRAEVTKIVKFILANMGKNNQTEIDNVRNSYLNNPMLLQIFDKLIMKYYSAKKCKEDIIRYILRKAFKTMRNTLITKERIGGRKASAILCKKYFSSNLEQIQKSGVDTSDEDELIEFFMPYRKKSKNKTMNTSFVFEIFGSEEFCAEYQNFLANFDDLLKDDNAKKLKKLIDVVVECVKSNSLHKLGGFNRLPWLDTWMEDTKNIAIGLMPNKKIVNNFKKTKIE